MTHDPDIEDLGAKFGNSGMIGRTDVDGTEGQFIADCI